MQSRGYSLIRKLIAEQEAPFKHDRDFEHHLKNHYGMTPEQHRAMYVAQNGCCGLCKKPVKYGEIHTDHDHKTGKVRGLLCCRCNTALGLFETCGAKIQDILTWITKGLQWRTDLTEDTRRTIREMVGRQIEEANEEGFKRYGSERQVTFKQEAAYRLCHQDFFGLNTKDAAEVMGITRQSLWELLDRVQEIAPQLFPVLPPRMARTYHLFMEGYTACEIAALLEIKTVRYVRRVLHWLWVRREKTGVYFRSDAGRRISYQPWMDTHVKEQFQMIQKEEGPEREFSTGAHKQAAAGKGTPVLVPADAYMEVAKHFEEGATLHGARNWEKGIPLSELINSLERHIAAEKMGKTDERHDRAMAWNALVYLATKARIQAGILPQELDDMPEYEPVVQVLKPLTCGECVTFQECGNVVYNDSACSCFVPKVPA